MPNQTPLDTLKSYVASQGWGWQPGAIIPYGEQVIVSAGATTAIVNFWPKRGKMIVQGANSSLRTALEAWVASAGSSTASKAGSGSSAGLIPPPHIGLDESGKGDWFGPLVVAAVYVDLPTATKLAQAGVQDSKALGAETIQRLARLIMQTVGADQRRVWVIAPPRYNALYADQQNINLLLAAAYAKVARVVWQATGAQTIVCDQFSQRADRLNQSFSAAGLPAPIQQHHAESASIAVAAASILASAAFSQALVDLGQLAGLGGPLPKGASDLALLHAAARHIITQHGAAAMGEYAKLNFKPVQALLKLGE